MSTTAVQTRPSGGNLAALQALLKTHESQIAVALPRHMTPERMIRVALSCVSGNSLLSQCEPISIAASIVQLSILGLEPNSLLAEAYLVPFWNTKANNGKGAYQAQPMPGYMGLLKLARNSGEVSMVDAQSVYSNDTFEFHKGSEVYWKHKWNRSGDRGDPEGVWAGYVLKDGSKNFEYWTVEQIKEHRDRYSQGAYKKDHGKLVLDKDGEKILQGAWLDSPEWMYKKTVLKQVIKLMPKSIELASALAIDERQDAGMSDVYTVDMPQGLLPEATGEGVSEPAQLQPPQRKGAAQPQPQPEPDGFALSEEQMREEVARLDAKRK